jgi:hypothetical protein
MNKFFSIFLIFISLQFTSQVFAQEVDIVPYLKMIEQGKLEEAKAKLLDLKI